MVSFHLIFYVIFTIAAIVVVLSTWSYEEYYNPRLKKSESHLNYLNKKSEAITTKHPFLFLFCLFLCFVPIIGLFFTICMSDYFHSRNRYYGNAFVNLKSHAKMFSTDAFLGSFLVASLGLILFLV